MCGVETIRFPYLSALKIELIHVHFCTDAFSVDFVIYSFYKFTVLAVAVDTTGESVDQLLFIMTFEMNIYNAYQTPNFEHTTNTEYQIPNTKHRTLHDAHIAHFIFLFTSFNINDGSEWMRPLLFLP